MVRDTTVAVRIRISKKGVPSIGSFLKGYFRLRIEKTHEFGKHRNSRLEICSKVSYVDFMSKSRSYVLGKAQEGE